MKKIVLFIFLICGFVISYSQITIESNEFAIEGSKFIMPYDTNYYNLDFSGTGEQTWDFSYLIDDNVADTFYIENPSVSPVADSFPDANFFLRIKTANNDTMYQSLKLNNAIELLGYYVRSSGNRMLQINTPPYKMSALPLTYSPNQLNVFSFLRQEWATMTSDVNTYYTEKKIKDTVVIDAWGKMDLPDFSALNVLRVHEKEYKTRIVYKISPSNDTTELGRDTSKTESYKWFTDDSRVAFLVLQIDIDEDTSIQFVKTANVVLSQNEILTSSNGIRLFPNPAREYFRIYNFPEKCTDVEIYNSKGQMVKKIIAENAKKDILVENFEPGIYFVKFKGTNFVNKLIVH